MKVELIAIIETTWHSEAVRLSQVREEALKRANYDQVEMMYYYSNVSMN